MNSSLIYIAFTARSQKKLFLKLLRTTMFNAKTYYRKRNYGF